MTVSVTRPMRTGPLSGGTPPHRHDGSGSPRPVRGPPSHRAAARWPTSVKKIVETAALEGLRRPEATARPWYPPMV
ncbi:hypothetical protein [Streptomyces sp. NPDC010273]|uniref:hypothetical protein n=1 Tax=Streptomyces sp. NPDC010273 TaxID=3364829 RepID=UPI0036EFFC25